MKLLPEKKMKNKKIVPRYFYLAKIASITSRRGGKTTRAPVELIRPICYFAGSAYAARGQTA
jgi:hypothetical protein